jgi:membrane fusion protein, multidrug efflux system
MMKSKQLFSIFLTITLLYACGEQKSKAKIESPIPVKTMQLVSQQMNKSLELSGNTQAFKSVNFGFMVAGKVKAVNVEEGEYVNKGALIAELDPTDYLFAVDAANAQFQRASSEYARLKKLFALGSLTQSDYDKITALYKEAKANSEYKQKQMADTKLYAPISGFISFDPVQPGEIVKQGMPIFQMIDTKQIYAVAYVPENEIQEIVSDTKVAVNLPSYKDTVFVGKVSQIAQAAEKFSRSFKVKCLVENPDLKIKAGLIALIQIPIKSTTTSIFIPTDVILRDANGETYVFVTTSDKAAKRKIRTANVNGNQVEVTHGLNAGDFLVTQGHTKLFEGAKVEVKN